MFKPNFQAKFSSQIFKPNFQAKFKLLIFSVLYFLFIIPFFAQVNCSNQTIDINFNPCTACFDLVPADNTISYWDWTLYSPLAGVCETSDDEEFCTRICFGGSYQICVTGHYADGTECTTCKTFLGCNTAGQCDPNKAPQEKPGITFIYLEQCGRNGKYSVRVKPTCLPYQYSIVYLGKKNGCNGPQGMDTIELNYPDNDCAELNMEWACVEAYLPASCCNAEFRGYYGIAAPSYQAICPNCTACSPACTGPFVDVTNPDCSDPGGNMIDGGSYNDRQWIIDDKLDKNLQDKSGGTKIIQYAEVYNLSGKRLMALSPGTDFVTLQQKLSERSSFMNQLLIFRLVYTDGSTVVTKALMYNK